MLQSTGFHCYPKIQCSYDTCCKPKWHKAKEYPRFPKVPIMSLCFYKRPTLVPIFANQKKSKEDFRFYKKSHYHTNRDLS